ncbi:hypothetical protein [Nitrobacter sp.]|jgi:hypothetical protein|uniref:hypothetical protein n=1 Tax=Nitrobacter sp. TaxID=29420 RepID=UPI003F64FCCF
MKIAPFDLAQQNQFLLTIRGQDPNQLLKGVSSAASIAAGLTPGAATIRGLACAFC